MDDILKKLEQKYNCSAVNFYKYKESFVIKGLDKSKEYVSFRYFITKNDEIDEINDKILIDYFSKGENKPSDVIY